MTPAQARELIPALRRVARKYASKFWWADPRDLEQEAWMAALHAAPRWERGKGTTLIGWCSAAAAWALRDFGMQNATPLTPAHKKKWDWRAVSAIPITSTGAAPEEDERGELQLEDPGPTPDAAAERARVHAMVEVAVRAAIRQADATGLAGPVLLGGKTPAQMARWSKVPEADARRAVSELRAKLAKDDTLRKLWKGTGT